MLCVVSCSLAGTYSGGIGIEIDPYQISSFNDWLELTNTSSDWDCHFIMTADIDLENHMVNCVGTISIPFSGAFHGQGHVLSNIRIFEPYLSNVGLFGYISHGGIIRELGLENIDIIGGSVVGGLAGSIHWTTIQNCYVKGTVQGGSSVGGLVGSIGYDSSISCCYAQVDVTGTEEVGGLAGGNRSGSGIDKSYCTGRVTGQASTGGLTGGTFPRNRSVLSCFWDSQTSLQSNSQGSGRGLPTHEMKSLKTFQNAGWGGTQWVMVDELDYPRLTWENTGYPAIPPVQVSYSGSGTEIDPYQIFTAQEFADLSGYYDILDKHFQLMANIDLGNMSVYPIGDLGVFQGTFDGNGYTISNVDIRQTEDDCVALFAFLEGGTICNLRVEAIRVVGDEYVAGLVGYVSDGMIKQCYVSGWVTETYRVPNPGDPYEPESFGYSGGLAGENAGIILSSCSDVSVTGNQHIGGFIGENYGTIKNCYADGSVTGFAILGGFAAKNYGLIENCYFSGYFLPDILDINPFDGAFIGVNVEGARTLGCFWNADSSAWPGSSIGKGLTDGQMKTLSIFQNAGWGGEEGDPSPWVMRDGSDSPRLVWENTGYPPIPYQESVPFAGMGTEQNPYEVWTCEDFASLSWYPQILDKHIVLKADIDLQNIAVYPIGDLGLFEGVFDGKNHIISNVEIDIPKTSSIGLFHTITAVGHIQNLHLEDIVVKSNSDYAGGLAGINQGKIENCSLNGFVLSDRNVGGLVGRNQGTIRGCKIRGIVLGKTDVGGIAGCNYYDEAWIDCSSSEALVKGTWGGAGGIIGKNSGMVSQCFSSGSVSGQSEVGGLVGKNYHSISNSYAVCTTKSQSTTGGITGSNTGVISGCYSASMVSGLDLAGGIAGSSSSNAFDAVFWDLDISQLQYGSGNLTYNPAGLNGLSTIEMQTKNTYMQSGWNFDSNGGIPTWWMPVKYYPKLSWQSKISCKGSTELSLEPNEQGALTVQICSQVNELIDWSFDNYDCPWIISIDLPDGSSSGPNDITSINIQVDSTGLDLGTYRRMLSINSRACPSLDVVVTLNVVNRVGFEEYNNISQFWNTYPCEEANPCSSADWYRDGKIDILDFYQMASYWLQDEILVCDLTNIDFESEVFPPLPWGFSGDGDWKIDWTAGYGSYFSVKSPDLATHENSSMTIMLDTTYRNMSFYRKTNTRKDYNLLEFYIDGSKKKTWSGNKKWRKFKFSISPGPHIFTWKYIKNQESDYDYVWIDKISLY